MSTYMYIYLRPDFQQTKDQIWANIHYLQGYTSESLTAYQELATKMREKLPGIDLPDDQIICSKIVKLTYCNSFSLVSWSGMIPKTNNFKESGWHITDKSPEYFFS